MGILNFSQASRDGLREEMQHDPTVWALGEDLGKGGIFSQYEGLADEFGAARIVDTPISEAKIMGAAVGAAMAGTRPSTSATTWRGWSVRSPSSSSPFSSLYFTVFETISSSL